VGKTLVSYATALLSDLYMETVYPEGFSGFTQCLQAHTRIIFPIKS